MNIIFEEIFEADIDSTYGENEYVIEDEYIDPRKDMTQFQMYVE